MSCPSPASRPAVVTLLAGCEECACAHGLAVALAVALWWLVVDNVSPGRGVVVLQENLRRSPRPQLNLLLQPPSPLSLPCGTPLGGRPTLFTRSARYKVVYGNLYH